MTEPIISIRDLTVSYGGRRVLNGITLDVQRGEVIALLGASGSGKSTMLKHIIGLAKPDSGTIHIQGVDINRCSARELRAIRRDLGVAFQGSARELTTLSDPVIEIMTFIKLASVGLGEAGKMMPQELSGGMKKRAAVARATALDPEILIFDEPSAGLDPIVAAELDELILFLKRAFHMTVVIVTHEMASAFRVADRLAMLYMGSLIAVEGKETFSGSSDPRIRQFLDRKPQHIAESESVQRRLRALVSMTGATE
jgi:phospholipid/cholesterol/gamma-HCH transport system ATP-binding protein